MKYSANVNGKPYKFDVAATKPPKLPNPRVWGKTLAVSKALNKAKA